MGRFGTYPGPNTERSFPTAGRRRSKLMSILFVLLGFLLQTPASAAAPPQAAGNPIVVIDTSEGSITVELYKDRAPVSVANFLEYVKDGFYPGTIWQIGRAHV